MPKLISDGKKHWKTRIKCRVCRHIYEYYESDVVVDSGVVAVYCGSCKATLPAGSVPKRVINNANHY